MTLSLDALRYKADLDRVNWLLDIWTVDTCHFLGWLPDFAHKNGAGRSPGHQYSIIVRYSLVSSKIVVFTVNLSWHASQITNIYT